MILIVPLLALVLAGLGCSRIGMPSLPSLPSLHSTPPAQEASVAGDTSTITIEADSYSFKPGEVHIEAPGSYILQVKNLTGSKQDLTLKDQGGKVIKTWSVSPKSTAISNLDLPAAGTYELSGDSVLRVYSMRKTKIVVGPAK